MHPLILAIYRAFGRPVPFQSMFGDVTAPVFHSKTLEGDPTMPPTTKSGILWWFLNPLRNAYLATFVWREWSVLDLGNAWTQEDQKFVYVVYYDAARIYSDEERTHQARVLPHMIRTRFVAVRHGRERCTIALVGADGYGRGFSVVARGGMEEVHDAVLTRRSGELSRTLDERDVRLTLAAENLKDELITYV